MNESDIKQDQQNVGKSNDEIDLLEISSRAWKGFRNFFVSTLVFLKDFVVAFVIFTIRKSVWVFSFALIGVALGFVYGTLKKPYYTSMLEGYSGGVDNSVVIDHINQLNRMVKKPEVLASFLGISPEQAEQIRYLKALYGIDVNFDGKWDYVDEKGLYDPGKMKDTIRVRVPSVFFVRIRLYDEEILPILRERLFQHINNNAYIQNLYDIDKRQKEALIAELEREIEKIDRLDTLQHSLRLGSSNRGLEMGEKIYLFGSNEPELRLFYTDILSLYSQKQSLQRSIDISDEPVIIIQDFIAAQYEEKGASYYSIRLGLALVVLGYIVAVCWTFRKKLRKAIIEDPIKYFE